MSLPHFIMKKPNSPVMTHDTDILEAMTSLSMFKKYWSTKVENLTNYPLENEKDRKYVHMFEKLVEFARARLEYAKDKLEGWSDVSESPSPNTNQEA